MALLEVRWRANMSFRVRAVATVLPEPLQLFVLDRNRCSGSFQPLQRSRRVAERVETRLYTKPVRPGSKRTGPGWIPRPHPRSDPDPNQ